MTAMTFAAIFISTFLVSVVSVGAVLDLRYVPQHRPDGHGEAARLTPRKDQAAEPSYVPRSEVMTVMAERTT